MKRFIALFLLLVTALAAAQTRSGTSSNMFDSAALLNDLKRLSADDMEGRRVATPGGAKARAYVVDRLQESGVAPIGGTYLQPFTFMTNAGRGAAEIASEIQGVNVICQIEGSTNPRRYIVVSAHYDHLGVRNGGVFHGADDNASGTAALFAIAKYFSVNKPANSLIVAAFDAEESGLRGSRAFVAMPPVAKESMVIDVNLDMIARDPDDKLFAVGTFLNPFLKPYIASVASTAPVKLLMGHDDPSQKKVEDWTADSDHASFQGAGIPAVYLGVEDFDQHHKTTDTYETITPNFYIHAVETSIALIKTFDKNLDAIRASKKTN